MNHFEVEHFIRVQAWRIGYRLKSAAWHYRRYKDTPEFVAYRTSFLDAVFHARCIVQDARSIGGRYLLAMVIREMRKGCKI